MIPLPEVQRWREQRKRWPAQQAPRNPDGVAVAFTIAAGDALCDLVERQQEELRAWKSRAFDSENWWNAAEARALEAERQIVELKERIHFCSGSCNREVSPSPQQEKDASR